MDTSIFTVKSLPPGDTELRNALASTYQHWCDLNDHCSELFSGLQEEWNFSKFGWNCRLKHKKRVVIYLMPLERAFNASFVFGERATEAALASSLPEEVKNAIRSAPVYAEGRGFRLKVDSATAAEQIKQLITLKKQY